MECSKDHGKSECKCSSVITCTQTLDEMEFERGIWSAAQSGDLERVKKLSAQGVDKVDQAGYTALHYAARCGNLEICKLLLSLGAEVNAQTRSGLATPLHRAATAGRYDIVKLLIDKRANLNLQDADGQTPLHRAALEGHYDIMKHILSIDKASLSVKDNRGRLPSDLPAKNLSDIDFLKLFD